MNEITELKKVLYRDRVYASLQVLGQRKISKSEELDLRLMELRLFSQNGEDGVTHALTEFLDLGTPFFVEFGVGDGWSCNTRLLAEVLGWNGLIMECGNGFSTVSERYKFSETVQCANERVTPQNINELFKKYEVPENLAVLSIDVDGQDYWIWESLDGSYMPAIVIIEYNSALGATNRVVEKEGQTVNALTETWGASLGAMEKLADEKGYKLVHCEMAGINAFFVRKELLVGKSVTGVLNRSPNFGLDGKYHSDAVLFASTSGTNREMIDLG